MDNSGFYFHLVELRQRLIRYLIALSILVIIFFPFSDNLFDLFAQPLLSQLPEGQKLIAINVVSTIFVPLKLTLFLAFFISVPYLLYQVWTFIAPGLYRNERRFTWTLLVTSSVLFYLGVLFAYLVVFPMIFKFLVGNAPSTVLPTPDIGEFLNFCVKLFIAFGLGFEIPVVTFIIIYLNIVTHEQLKKSRPYVIIGAFTFGMLLTPPDVLSQILLAIPMCLLFELGLILGKYQTNKKGPN